MAKRYHSSRRGEYGNMRTGAMSAHETMHSAGSFIAEDHSASCLLPTHIIQKMFPSGPCGMGSEQQYDLYSGVSKMMTKTAAEFRKEKKALNY